ncbi:MAG: nucleotide exchange factor GrpE [Candidatus Subteraquimicrobiales bacterium]|nr:nucleotide exchange factor GrpE [Candidatus Subteraquimicrobiales bacterium]
MSEEKKKAAKEEKPEKESKASSLKKEFEEKEKEVADYLDRLKRLQAEFENYKKRILKEQTQFLELASQNIISELLSVLDNLERALASSKEGGNFESFIKGVEMVHNQFLQVLEGAGLKVVNPIGKHFDPREHEAFLQVESNEHEEGTIVEVLQKGYLLKDRVLRPAIVKVAKNSQG